MVNVVNTIRAKDVSMLALSGIVQIFCAHSKNYKIPNKLFTWLMKMNLSLVFLFIWCNICTN